MLTIEAAPAEAARFIETIPPYPADRFSGRGIVTCAGGVKYLTCAWVLINILRRHGCTLPIEVWYLGEDEGDPEWIELVRPLGVECIDAHAVREKHPHPRLGGLESKPNAILHSRFKEVLFLDADNAPIRDPSFLFDCNEYRRTGAVFWPDLAPRRTAGAAEKVFGVEARIEHEFESGQMLIDKQRCWTALNLCDWYNRHSDFFYQHVFGDKDTFRFAWRRMCQEFEMPTTLPTPAEFSLCQHDFAGQPLFRHRIHDKWTIAGCRSGGSEHESRCTNFIAELSRRWMPDRHLTRKLTKRDRATCRQLVGRDFYCQRLGRAGWRMSLGKNNRVADGWTASEFFWWCDADHMVFAGIDGKPTSRLKRLGDGTWRGDSAKDGFTIQLRPEHGATPVKPAVV